MPEICSTEFTRKNALHRSRCGMVVEPGYTLCAVHLKSAGYQRCVQSDCSEWLQEYQPRCPKGHDQPPKN